ncbi:putative CBL-interacting protein kinase 13 [Hordeum vulgare]|nr:putative CBL-interacting protein kinase 13 [Hordeum vulgare]
MAEDEVEKSLSVKELEVEYQRELWRSHSYEYCNLEGNDEDDDMTDFIWGDMQSTNGGMLRGQVISEDERKCSYLEWVDQEWPQSLKMCLAKLWSMNEEENRDRLRGSVENAEECSKMREKKRRMEHELIFFKLDYAKMVSVGEKLVLTELKA